MTDKKKFRFYALHPDGGGPKGLVWKKPKLRKQDKTFKPAEYYAVVFFPRIAMLGPATADWYSTMDTISRSPAAAITKFMDHIKQGQKWETYHKAGHRVRKIKISDLGDATPK